MSEQDVFRALGDPTRMGLVEELGRGPRTASQLAEGRRLTLTGLLKHVTVLEEAGLVRRTKVGRVVTVSLRPEGFRAAEAWLSDRRAYWSATLDRLGDLVDSPSPAPYPTKRDQP